ncbi:MAG TPA: outer membrane lipoprotein chaperone LolA [Thermoanaerobaculia bacterium]|nr:outer membrane lipoprotein chaperone LolA [Thermoanaerobaculia bacterium]
MTLLFTGSLVAQPPAAIDRAAAAIAGQEAAFVHQFTPKGFRSGQTERGRVLFGRLPMMKWMYSSPEEKLFLFDGRTSWFYVPAEKQVTTADVDDSRKRELPFLLIGDPAARTRHFSVSEKRDRGKIVITLQPRDRHAMIRRIVVTSDAASDLIESIEYNDRQGNRTSFHLSGYTPRDAGAAAFQFTPPPGVQVVRAD